MIAQNHYGGILGHRLQQLAHALIGDLVGLRHELNGLDRREDHDGRLRGHHGPRVDELLRAERGGRQDDDGEEESEEVRHGLVVRCSSGGGVRLGHPHIVDHPRPWPSSNQPGKLFEYLATGREILALCGVGAAADLLAELGVGVSARPDDVEGIRQALVDLWERKVAGDLRTTVDAHRLLPYHRRELARELASCFDAVVEAGGAAKGLADAG